MSEFKSQPLQETVESPEEKIEKDYQAKLQWLEGLVELNPHAPKDKEFLDHLSNKKTTDYITPEELTRRTEMFKIIITHEFNKFRQQGLQPQEITKKLLNMPLILKGTLSPHIEYTDGFDKSWEMTKKVKDGNRWNSYGWIASSFSGKAEDIMEANLDSLGRDKENSFSEKTIQAEMSLLTELREKAPADVQHKFDEIMEKKGYRYKPENKIYEKIL